MAGILALTLAFAQVTPVSAFAEEAIAATDAEQTIYTGTCGAEGDNITWTYDTTTQTMTFSGTGSMGLERYAITTDLMPWRQGDVASVYNAKMLCLKRELQILVISQITRFWSKCRWIYTYCSR